MKSLLSLVVVFILTMASTALAGEVSCLNLSNQALKKINIQNYYKPAGEKVSYKADSEAFQETINEISTELSKSRRKYLGDSRGRARRYRRKDFNSLSSTKKRKKNLSQTRKNFGLYGVNLQMEKLMKAGVKFTDVTLFKNSENKVQLFYNEGTLVSISITSLEKDEGESYKQSDLLMVSGCKASRIIRMEEHEHSIRYRYLSSATCHNLDGIRNRALSIDDNINDYEFQCKSQGGYFSSSCLCTGNNPHYINPFSESCDKGGKLREIVNLPPWRIFENHIKKDDSLWSLSEYTKSTFLDLEKACSNYKGLIAPKKTGKRQELLKGKIKPEKRQELLKGKVKPGQ